MDKYSALPNQGVKTPALARRISTLLYSKVKLRLTLLLAAPLTWLVLVYIAALLALLVTALYSVDSYTSQIQTQLTFKNVIKVLTGQVYQTVALRTLGIALLVTIVDTLIALPIAFYMAKIASPRLQRVLVIAVLMPLWASYLVKAYAWRSVLSNEGIMQWLLRPLGLDTPGYGITATIITLGYLWLPYVILPIYAGLERVPNSLLEASGDLGAKTSTTLRLVMLPMLVPAIIAGSIFSFSLTMGDYITVNIVGGANQMLGNLVATNVGNNLPLAAAIALIPVLIMFGYLTAVRKTGALENL
jgi:putative spermidine/putrescine transport system permease protein